MANSGISLIERDLDVRQLSNNNLIANFAKVLQCNSLISL